MSRIVRGDSGIEVMMKDYFGKRPGLYLYNASDNVATKVGTFGSEEKAKMFEEYLMYLCGLDGKPKEESQC